MKQADSTDPFCDGGCSPPLTDNKNSREDLVQELSPPAVDGELSNSNRQLLELTPDEEDVVQLLRSVNDGAAIRGTAKNNNSLTESRSEAPPRRVRSQVAPKKLNPKRNRGSRPIVISDDHSQLLTPTEVGHLLKLSSEAVVRRFVDSPGVYDIGSEEVVGRYGKEKPKRRYRMLRIPRHVLDRYLLSTRV
jgi:hypothetical protein